MNISHFYHRIKPCYICIPKVQAVVFATCPEDTLELENAYRWAIRIIKGMEQLPYKGGTRKAELLALANRGLRICEADKAIVFTNQVTAQLVLKHFILELASSRQKTHLAQTKVCFVPPPSPDPCCCMAWWWWQGEPDAGNP